MYCKNCGEVVEDCFKTCPYCGKTIRKEPKPYIDPHFNASFRDDYYESDLDKATVLLLCWFFGALGAHRFYVGKLGTGILWLLTGGLFGIGVTIDLIYILCGNFTDSAGKPITEWYW